MKTVILILLSTISVLWGTETLTYQETKGSTVGKYAKPGAPVDITYTSQNVSAGAVSEVNIVLSTAAKNGTMKVKLNSDKGLSFAKEYSQTLQYDLNEKQHEYPLQLLMSADSDGVYYIKLLVNIEGEGTRAFAVPVYIGEGRVKKTKGKAVSKSALGENISVSKAVESTE